MGVYGFKGVLLFRSGDDAWELARSVGMNNAVEEFQPIVEERAQRGNSSVNDFAIIQAAR